MPGVDHPSDLAQMTDVDAETFQVIACGNVLPSLPQSPAAMKSVIRTIVAAFRVQLKYLLPDMWDVLDSR
jgi:hypothetical protein